MDKDGPTVFLWKMLHQTPNHMFILGDGSAAAMLGGPDQNVVLIAVAPEERNFNQMTDEEVNKYIQDNLK